MLHKLHVLGMKDDLSESYLWFLISLKISPLLRHNCLIFFMQILLIAEKDILLYSSYHKFREGMGGSIF